MKRFIHIPKNGGLSIVKFCRDHNLDVLYGVPKFNNRITKKHATNQYWHHEPSKKFAIVRNPLSRLVSWFNYLTRLEAYHCTFTDFVLHKIEPEAKNFKTPSPWTLQSHWIKVDNQISNIDLFAFEQMHFTIPEYFNLRKPLPHENKSNKTDEKDYYTSETKKLVETHFFEDYLIWQSLTSK